MSEQCIKAPFYEISGSQLSQNENPGRDDKVFCDPVWGHIRLHPVCVDIMDTPQFQRLRWLKQLGLAHYVYLGATHTRFEHSLGVSYKAGQMASRIYQTQGHELGMEEADVKAVCIAGLCHDLGHGPFSHVFENELLPRILSEGEHWHHEEMSGKMLDYIVDQNYIDISEMELIQRDLATIKDMMTGHVPPEVSEKRFLFDIVANKRNGIDVDKFDYLQRDSFNTGVKVACDIQRLMEFCKVFDDQICFKYSEYQELIQLFNDRARMHQRVYTHRKVKAVEFMVTDALLEAEPILDIRNRLQDADEFLTLDDTLLVNVQRLQANLCGEHEGAILRAQAILHRLHTRELYCHCDEVVMPPGDQRPVPSSSVIYGFIHQDGLVDVDVEDIIVRETRVDYSMRDQNPLDHVKFFDRKNNIFTIDPRSITNIMTQNYMERRVRVYCKKREPRIVQAVAAAFKRWIKEVLPTHAHFSTPLKDARKRRREQSPFFDSPNRCGSQGYQPSPIV